ncbi:DUF5683 domain-containing protein [Hymenobacter sublimis]|uniref:DUF5683 domain-containing protein n=1 Tax=Hymenobacter sublimis TaxID=2933777 RepID=A0ABY4JH37_9BACT|nr:DUF5683 domain-containing protein [Hymenobacter sublimis]UPL51222.1 DUF5683 domain-containing protein [Hymenobacter sublimis]
MLLGKSAQAQTVTAGPDSARVATQAVPDSSRRTERLLGMRVTRPQKAALLALVLPGAGQVYNHKYWKLPLVYGAIGGTGYGLYFYQIRYKAYAKAKNELLAGKTVAQVTNNLVDEVNAQGVQTGLNNYRTSRDTFIAYTALAYGITILDALVDAHLRDFDISEDLSLRLDPALLPSASPVPRTGLALTFYLK